MYIKINTTVTLNSGLSIPSGSVVTIAEGYASIKDIKDGLIPSQIATFIYASEEAYLQGLQPVQGVADFNSVIQAQLTEEAYNSETAESLLVNAVVSELSKIYGADNIVVIQ